MSILGYSASYFLPEYWSNTPLYGEKILPLIDYILSTDFVQADKLANAFYIIENKYKNTADLPIDAIEAIIEESGYGYVKDLLGEDEDSLRLLVYLLVLIHQLKGSKLGIEVVLNLLKKGSDALVFGVVGKPTITSSRDVSNFSIADYVLYSGFTTDSSPFELTFQIRTSDNFRAEQCIASCGLYGFYLGIDTQGRLALSLGSKSRTSWDIANKTRSISILTPSTNYYVKLTFDGYEYDVKVSTDGGNKYSDYITVSSNVPTEIHKSIMYVGVDNSTGEISKPFLGFINLTPFAMDVQNIEIKEWFEEFPIVDEDGNNISPENTFIVKSDLDLGVVGTDFFKNFAEFVRKYVYPTLRAFEARTTFQSNLTFLPYVRQNIKYVAEADVMQRDLYMVIKPNTSPTERWNYTVLSSHQVRQDFEVIPEDVIITINPTPANATVVLTARDSTQVGNSITAPFGSKVSYTVSATGYQTKTGYYVSEEDATLNVVLEAVSN